MKLIKKITNILLLLIIPQAVLTQTAVDSIRVGYKDANHDGINDLFADADGDGKNDITNKPYPHDFRYEDKNKDGRNDYWLDKDGDGVNDLMVAILKKRGIRAQVRWVDKDGDGIQDADVKPIFKADLSEFVLDANKDGKNDITGIEITKDNTMGYRYGRIDEEKNKEIKKFTDKNSDGMHDKFANRFAQDMERRTSKRKFDYFIDADGDGIYDGRGFKRMEKHRSGHSYRKGKGP